MKLDIKNFAKIKEAEIIVDGITVIAGENNTGKSTVGKILFSLFNALSGIEEKIWKQRLKEIEFRNRATLQKYMGVFDDSRIIMSRNIDGAIGRINFQIRVKLEKNKAISKDMVSNIILKELRRWEDYLINEELLDIVYEIYNNIIKVLSLEEETIVLEVISRYFRDVFSGQVNSLIKNTENETIIDLQIKGKNNRIIFEKNVCKKFTEQVKIMHKAIYIDNPFLIDELSNYNELNPMNKLLKDLLIKNSNENIMDGIIETVLAKEKLSDVYKALQMVVDGEIIVNQSNDEFYLKSEGFHEPISFHNLSTGMKSFVIIKMLLENGCLKEKDILILDEPEIHLHPQWQIAYAELIVLLQKYFDLSVIVTTHSPYFVDAIHLFSYKYGTDKKVNYYLSSHLDNMIQMECVTQNIDLIYKKMASPIQILDTLRYELNNK